MKKLTSGILYLILLMAFMSCSKSQDTSRETQVSTPQFKAQIFCNNLKYGPNSGEIGPFDATGKMTCGYPGEVSEIVWQFIGHQNGKDKYRIERRFPADSSTAVTSLKEIEFIGKELIVFEDDIQKITIIPLTDEKH